MVLGFFQKFAFSGFAASIAAGASLVSGASVAPQPAYGLAAAKLEAAAAANNAAHIFDRADLDNNGILDRDEYEILAVVTAELAQLNGFIAIDAGRGLETVAIARAVDGSLDEASKARIEDRAGREFRLFAGDDERLASDEFVTAQLELFLATDADRNGVLAGAELKSYANSQSKLATLNS
ncbi:MAG: hypothetical protein AAB227_10045 [Pseudomonadota bacterium]